MLLGRFSGVQSCVALIDIGQFYRMARDLLHLLGQRGHLAAVALVGCGHGQGEQVA